MGLSRGGDVTSNKGRKRKNKKKGFSKFKKPTNMQIAKKLVSVEKQVSKLNTIAEVKYNDFYYNGVSFAGSPTTYITDTLGDVYVLNAMDQGDQPTQRSGNQIYVTSVIIKIRTWIPQDFLQPAMVRYMLVWIKTPNTTGGITLAPEVQDVLDTDLITNPILAPYDMENRPRFKIIKDWTVLINPQSSNGEVNAAGVIAATSTYLQYEYVDVYQKIGKKSTYLDEAGGFESMDTGLLTLFAVSDIPPALTNGPRNQIGSRCYYKDS